jgi:hypothetical protein
LLSPSPSASQIINKNYLHPLPTEFQINEAIEGWRYTLSERNQQQVTAMQYGIYRSLIITNQSPQQFVLESPLIKLERPDLKKLHSSGRVRKLENYNGTVAYELQSYAEQPDGEMRDVDLISYTVKDSRKKDSNVAEINRQFILKHNPTHFRFRVKSRFNGTLEIFQPCLSDIDSTFPAIDEMEGNIP